MMGCVSVDLKVANSEFLMVVRLAALLDRMLAAYLAS